MIDRIVVGVLVLGENVEKPVFPFGTSLTFECCLSKAFRLPVVNILKSCFGFDSFELKNDFSIHFSSEKLAFGIFLIFFGNIRFSTLEFYC